MDCCRRLPFQGQAGGQTPAQTQSTSNATQSPVNGTQNNNGAPTGGNDPNTNSGSYPAYPPIFGDPEQNNWLIQNFYGGNNQGGNPNPNPQPEPEPPPQNNYVPQAPQQLKDLQFTASGTHPGQYVANVLPGDYGGIGLDTLGTVADAYGTRVYTIGEIQGMAGNGGVGSIMFDNHDGSGLQTIQSQQAAIAAEKARVDAINAAAQAQFGPGPGGMSAGHYVDGQFIPSMPLSSFGSGPTFGGYSGGGSFGMGSTQAGHYVDGQFIPMPGVGGDMFSANTSVSGQVIGQGVGNNNPSAYANGQVPLNYNGAAAGAIHPNEHGVRALTTQERMQLAAAQERDNIARIEQQMNQPGLSYLELEGLKSQKLFAQGRLGNYTNSNQGLTYMSTNLNGLPSEWAHLSARPTGPNTAAILPYVAPGTPIPYNAALQQYAHAAGPMTPSSMGAVFGYGQHIGTQAQQNPVAIGSGGGYGGGGYSPPAVSTSVNGSIVPPSPAASPGFTPYGGNHGLGGSGSNQVSNPYGTGGSNPGGNGLPPATNDYLSGRGVTFYGDPSRDYQYGPGTPFYGDRPTPGGVNPGGISTNDGTPYTEYPSGWIEPNYDGGGTGDAGTGITSGFGGGSGGGPDYYQNPGDVSLNQLRPTGHGGLASGFLQGMLDGLYGYYPGDRPAPSISPVPYGPHLPGTGYSSLSGGGFAPTSNYSTGGWGGSNYVTGYDAI